MIKKRDLNEAGAIRAVTITVAFKTSDTVWAFSTDFDVSYLGTSP